VNIFGVEFFSSRSDDSAANEKPALHIVEDTDGVADSPSTHTTEDLFTIIHR